MRRMLQWGLSFVLTLLGVTLAFALGFGLFWGIYKAVDWAVSWLTNHLDPELVFAGFLFGVMLVVISVLYAEDVRRTIFDL